MQEKEKHQPENTTQPRHGLTAEQEVTLRQIREQSELDQQHMNAEVQAHIKKEREEAQQRPHQRSEQARIAELLWGAKDGEQGKQ